MDFHAEKPIYQQIVDYAFAKILSGEWDEGKRVPSVRELAGQMCVNTHTVLKAFDHLQSLDILVVKRGMGYFMADNARAKVNESRRKTFLTVTAPEFFKEMQLLGLTIEDVVAANQQQSDTAPHTP